MTTEQWLIVLGIGVTFIFAFAPWMFMVHAKLAVLCAQVERLDKKVDRICEAEENRVPGCVAHHARQDDHERRLSRIESHE